MKKYISMLILSMATLVAVAQTTTVTVTPSANRFGDYSGYLAVRDTLTDTDTTIYVVTLTGAKETITFACDVIKLTGTVAGKFDVYGSSDGVKYTTAVLTSVTKTDATAVYEIKLSANHYQKYRILSISSGTNTHSQRVHLLTRGKR
jgi:hypothetical protein